MFWENPPAFRGFEVFSSVLAASEMSWDYFHMLEKTTGIWTGNLTVVTDL